MQINDNYWELYRIYIEEAIDFFESIEPQDYEIATLIEQLSSILDHDDEVSIQNYNEMKELEKEHRAKTKRKE